MATRWRSVGVVVTPGSGEGRARGVARRLARLLRRRGSTVTIRAFGGLPALAEWAETAAAEFSVIFCIGGDATQSAAPRSPAAPIPFVPP
jgi:diacylglycerol kinase family enzyme